MKKIIGVLIMLVILTTCAAADEYVTIAELREQAKAGWNETYQTKSGEQTVNAEMGWFPKVEFCPLVTVESITMDEDDPRLDKWKAQSHNEIIIQDDRICIDLRDLHNYRLDPDYHGKLIYEDITYHDGEIPEYAPEGNDLSYDEFLALFGANLKEITGLEMTDIHIDSVKVASPRVKPNGEKFTANGMYSLSAQQLIRGVPVLGVYPVGMGYIHCNYHRPEYQSVAYICVKEKDIIKEDLPLLSFETLKEKLGKRVVNGKMKGILRMRFGYGSCKDGKVNKLVPIWVIECEQGRNYYINAQTGEPIERYDISAREESLRLPEILTWDDVK